MSSFGKSSRKASPRSSERAPLRRSAGESQMAVTAIDHSGRVITITSQLLESASSANPTTSPTFVTSVHGAALPTTVWQASSWTASLQHHATAVNKVIGAIASDFEVCRQLGEE